MSKRSVSVPAFVAIPVLASAALLFGAAVFGALPAPNQSPREREAQFTVVASKPEPRQAAAGSEVKIDNFSFGPQAVTVPVGTMITWINRDDIPHTVVSTDKMFKSKVLDTDEKFSFKFDKAGTYPYFCSIHPKMVGKVVVQ
jgi:plastocyanin